MRLSQIPDERPVVILGAGVNGAAVARELAVNGVPVVVVDTADLATGASSKSSRLIHGGLRYLEYGETDLVRESLEERGRLLRLAPQFVEPLRLYIPIRTRWRGIIAGARRLLHLGAPKPTPRGLWVVRLGLALYDAYARDRTLPGAATHRVGAPGVPTVDPKRYSWICSYSDARMPCPERFTLAQLQDAQSAAARSSKRFELLTYHRATREDRKLRIASILPGNGHDKIVSPSLIVNATGAWGDWTLEELPVPSKRLFAGTKGSHLLTFSPELREALGGEAIYAEADDGRLVFILPFGEATYIGTTDEPFPDRPDEAIATDSEIDYLIALTNEVVPAARLTRDQIESHCCGVRPLPYTDARTPASITRRHAIVEAEVEGIPVVTLIGGKLTTCRSLGEQTADLILSRLGIIRSASTRERLYPGAENYPATPAEREARLDRLAGQLGLSTEAVERVWKLAGTRAESILTSASPSDARILAGAAIPLAFVRHAIQEEWVRTLADLVERRLLLVFDSDLNDVTLRELGRIMVESGRLDAGALDEQVEQVRKRLKEHYGKNVWPTSASAQAGKEMMSSTRPRPSP